MAGDAHQRQNEINTYMNVPEWNICLLKASDDSIHDPCFVSVPEAVTAEWAFIVSHIY